MLRAICLGSSMAQGDGFDDIFEVVKSNGTFATSADGGRLVLQRSARWIGRPQPLDNRLCRRSVWRSDRKQLLQGSKAAIFEEVKNGNSYSGPNVLLSFGTSEEVNSLLLDSAGDLFGTTESLGSFATTSVFEVVDNNGTYASTPIILTTFAGHEPRHKRPHRRRRGRFVRHHRRRRRQR